MLFLFDTIWRHDQSGLACVRRLLSLYGSDRSVRNSTWVDLKIWIKFRPVRDLNPWPLRYQCSALPIELAKKLGAGYYVGSTTDTLCWRTLAYLQSLFLRFAFCLLVKLCIHTFLWMLSRKQTQTLLKVKIGFFICLRSPACGHCSPCTFLPMECFYEAPKLPVWTVAI